MVYLSISDKMNTTIKLEDKTKHNLDLFREYKNETYDEIVKKLVFIAQNIRKEPELSVETIKDIEKARERIRKGDFLTLDETKKRLGLDV